MTPPRLASQLHSLPPILHKMSLVPVSSCSKGSRGLSVLSRENCIFTAISISPSPCLRQWGSRYAIRAGRNLPDKEFRYLRTVIVTAAVYRGFGSLLRSEELTACLNLPAPGRRQTLYVVFTTLQSPVFLVNSRYPLVTATVPSSGSKSLHQRRHTFFRSYGVNLPSSLSTVLSSALGYSPCLPVSVYGTSTNASTHTRLFLEAWSHHLLAYSGHPITPRRNELAFIRTSSVYTLGPGLPSPGMAILLRPPLCST